MGKGRRNEEGVGGWECSRNGIKMEEEEGRKQKRKNGIS